MPPGRVGDLHDVVVEIGDVIGVVNDACRGLLLTRRASDHVVGPFHGARGIVDPRDAALALVAAGGRIPGDGDVLAGRGRILPGEEAPGIVVSQIGDDAARVGDLRHLAELAVFVNRRAGVRGGALDHFVEAVAHIIGVERARIAVFRDLILAVEREIDLRALLVGLADQPAQGVERPLIDVGARIGDGDEVVGLVVGRGPGLARRADEGQKPPSSSKVEVCDRSVVPPEFLIRRAVTLPKRL